MVSGDVVTSLFPQQENDTHAAAMDSIVANEMRRAAPAEEGTRQRAQLHIRRCGTDPVPTRFRRGAAVVPPWCRPSAAVVPTRCRPVPPGAAPVPPGAALVPPRCRPVAARARARARASSPPPPPRWTRDEPHHTHKKTPALLSRRSRGSRTGARRSGIRRRGSAASDNQ